MLQCTPHWSLMPGWPGTRCTGPWCGSWALSHVQDVYDDQGRNVPVSSGVECIRLGDSGTGKSRCKNGQCYNTKNLGRLKNFTVHTAYGSKIISPLSLGESWTEIKWSQNGFSCPVTFLLNGVWGDLQMAQLSTTMSQAQRATAFHFFTSNLVGATNKNILMFSQKTPFLVLTDGSRSAGLLRITVHLHLGSSALFELWKCQYKQVVCSSQELRHYPSMLSICIS